MAEDKKIKILCVEDESEIRENIVEILRDEGFEVFEAENGKKGFAVFAQEKPDLIISDIMMPELDGYGFLKMVRGSRNVKNNTVPFIFLTALGQKDNIIKGVGLSANDYLVKPIDFDLMIAKVKEKTSNALKVQEVQNRNIKNIKNQVSLVLPSELFSYLDVITQTAAILKTGPYGDFYSNRTIDDINRIYLNATKLRSAIINSLDESVIDAKLNSDEEIFSMFDFLNEFRNGLSQQIQGKVVVEVPFEKDALPKIKADKLILIDALRRIISALLKIDQSIKINIDIMIDHLDQMALIFYLKTDGEVANFKTKVDEEQINNILSKQNFLFKVIDNKEKSLVIIIPKYRLIK
ncbi:MAG: response regulator [Proteobacteria bacterium]|nr:response regulator [Pseudomonadota bacterium]